MAYLMLQVYKKSKKVKKKLKFYLFYVTNLLFSQNFYEFCFNNLLLNKLGFSKSYLSNLKEKKEA